MKTTRKDKMHWHSYVECVFTIPYGLFTQRTIHLQRSNENTILAQSYPQREIHPCRTRGITKRHERYQTKRRDVCSRSCVNSLFIFNWQCKRRCLLIRLLVNIKQSCYRHVIPKQLQFYITSPQIAIGIHQGILDKNVFFVQDFGIGGFDNFIPQNHLVLFTLRLVICHYIYKKLFNIPMKRWCQIHLEIKTQQGTVDASVSFEIPQCIEGKLFNDCNGES